MIVKIAERIIILLAIVSASVSGVVLVVGGNPDAGFTALCFASLESIYYEIKYRP